MLPGVNVADLCMISELQKIIGAGRRTAVEIGTAAGAKICVGRRVLWNVSKVKKYLDEISE
jgi:hypothetical protein